ncbi:MAG: type I pullulanase [Clostridiales bacterium]|nr:type I pullulanase [Clostridiales bacterium]
MKRFLAILLVVVMLAAYGCVKDPDKPADPTEAPAGDPTAEPYEEYDLPREPGTNRLVFYWTAEGVNYDKCDMWIWYPNADGHGYLFHRCEYGVKVMLNVPEDVTEVGFIVRKNCSDPGGASWGDAEKDYDGDRWAKIEGDVTEIYLKAGDGAQYKSNDGGKTLYQEKEFNLAGIVAMNKIKYNITPALRITSLDQIKVYEGDREIEIEEVSSLDNEVVTGIITLKEELDISKVYTVWIDGYERKNAVPTAVFDTPEFIEKYCYDGADLGASCFPDGAVFKLWAPTASSVKLNLYTAGDGDNLIGTFDMERGDRGVWRAESSYGPGVYYTYTVTTAAGTFETVDPYAKAVGVNGDRGMVVDLSATDPEGWENDTYYTGIEAYNEAVIWEVHVRDFSNRITSSRFPGKYLAFTENGLVNEAGEPVGLDYLVDLGITHVHLQPVYDYATVDESSDAPQFNWGYDPKNYNVPEGSYSTDPYHGEVRITEFKQMVQALHNAGIGVIMDVVYNHTYSADSNFTKTVPYYYYRYTPSGDLSNGSGCGNETASERAMFRKFMVDSVTYWAKEYHLDGFRFDLMALHDVDTMQEIEEAVHALNPHAIIYGEGWTGGSTTLMENKMANQKNIHKIVPHGIGGVAVFNDTIRDGLKGSVFNAADKGYINGKPSMTANVIFGIEGGKKTQTSSWGVERNEVINYMACHDNNTLYDKLILSNPDATDEERFIMYTFGEAIIMLSKGTPFMLAGEEMLRTKGGDHNSYNSPDSVNNIDWDALTQGSDAMRMRDFMRALIHMRRSYDFFTKADVTCTVLDANVIEVVWTVDGEEVARAVINPNAEAYEYTVEGRYTLLMNGLEVAAGSAELPFYEGTGEVMAMGVMILVK